MLILHKLNVPDEEVCDVAAELREQFGMMFDNAENMMYEMETRRVPWPRSGRIEGARLRGEQLLLIKLVIEIMKKITLLNKLLKFLKESLDIHSANPMISPQMCFLIIILISF